MTEIFNGKKWVKPTKKNKTLKKPGNWNDVYVAGEYVRGKWNRRWLVKDVAYDSNTDISTIKLQDTEE